MSKYIRSILAIIPLLAPVPAAWVVFRSAIEYLAWPWPVAGIAALVLEGLGFVSVNLAQRMYTFNLTLRMDEKSHKFVAPTWQAIAITFLYLAVAISMITLLDIFTSLIKILPAIFPLLGVTGAALWAIYFEQDSREGLVAEYRKQRQQARHEKKASTASSDKFAPQVARKLIKPDKQVSKQPLQVEALLAYWRDHPQASDQQVAEQFGKSRQAIQQRREKLIHQGMIRGGDKGIEIVGILVGKQSTTVR
jgi:hypothetical protein